MEFAALLAADLAIALAEQMEELDTTNHEFQTVLARAFQRMFAVVCSAGQSSKVFIFDDAIPGFTVMLLIEQLQSDQLQQAQLQQAQLQQAQLQQDSAPAQPPRSPMSHSSNVCAVTPSHAAAAAIIDTFVSRTGNRVFVIEIQDAICLLFPSCDLRRNLREIGAFGE